MASHTATPFAELGDSLREGGSWITVYTDASMDTSDPRGVAQARRRSVLDRLKAEGVPGEQLATLGDALEGTDGMPSPITRYVLMHDGEIVCNLLFPGAPNAPELAEVGPAPRLVPLVTARTEEFVYLVVEASRDGGDVSVFRSTQVIPEVTEQTQGRTDAIKKFQGGGWAHLRFQHHTEDIWRQNETELAAVVDRLADEHGARLILLAGDVHARQLLVEQLAIRNKELVVQLNANTRPEGASEETLDAFVDEQLDKLRAADEAADLDRLRQELGRDGGAAERGVGSIVHAVRQAQVDTLFLDPAALEDRTLLALDAEPWVATAPEDAEPAGILGSVPAADALIRAAALTDANVRIVSGPVMPDGSGVAGTLRWSSAANTGG
ncbi:Vms1/Ankzf1 family peptidyl-tRNA hydrolase [Naasia sp. SYSU D00057]|uniref:baeRF2 domain-containing protein n=1 Tax=Naasia sp. SYSU D00057 TaxID=2817380 RepID=UPI001B31413E|nr:Vms1/Ankzf1 family peptidyl-tRNA hydrolase [Naasia sp. SYSU D00057]